MTHIQYLVVVLVLVASTSASVAYERTTHRELSTAAAQSSALQTDQYILSNLGLKSSDKFRNSKNQERSIFGLIEDGADFEDDHTRPLNHFYDPLRNRGLFGVNIASPDWALEDARDVDSQEFSYKDARDYLYQALTSPTEDARKQFFGKTFQALGQVVHHLQDMAQPQHVRNDIHPSVGSHKSLYEDYINYHRGKLLYTGYDPVTFPSATGRSS